MARPKSLKTVAKSIQADYDRHRKLIEESMQDLNPGSAAYLNRVTALAKLAQAHRQELVDRGIMPSNLGQATRIIYEWRATTSAAPDTRDAARKLLEEKYDREYGYAYGNGPDDDDEEPPQAAPVAVAPVAPKPAPVVARRKEPK